MILWPLYLPCWLKWSMSLGGRTTICKIGNGLCFISTKSVFHYIEMSCFIKKYINLFKISTQMQRWYDPMGHYNAGEIKHYYMIVVFWLCKNCLQFFSSFTWRKSAIFDIVLWVLSRFSSKKNYSPLGSIIWIVFELHYRRMWEKFWND